MVNAVSCNMQEPAKLWEKLLLSLDVPGSEPGVDAEEEITASTKEKVPAAVWDIKTLWKLLTLHNIMRSNFYIHGKNLEL